MKRTQHRNRIRIRVKLNKMLSEIKNFWNSNQQKSLFESIVQNAGLESLAIDAHNQTTCPLIPILCIFYTNIWVTDIIGFVTEKDRHKYNTSQEPRVERDDKEWLRNRSPFSVFTTCVASLSTALSLSRSLSDHCWSLSFSLDSIRAVHSFTYRDWLGSGRIARVSVWSSVGQQLSLFRNKWSETLSIMSERFSLGSALVWLLIRQIGFSVYSPKILFIIIRAILRTDYAKLNQT